jgi:hypothetical protein
MKKMTRIQKITLVLILAAILWEIAVRTWMRSLPESDPVIRADLFFIITLLAVFITISVIQKFQKYRLDDKL